MTDEKDNVVDISPFVQEKHPKHLEDLSNLLDSLPQLSTEQKERLLVGIKPLLDDMRSPPTKIDPENTQRLDAFINRAVTVAVTASLQRDAYKMLYDEGNKNE